MLSIPVPLGTGLMLWLCFSVFHYVLCRHQQLTPAVYISWLNRLHIHFKMTAFDNLFNLLQDTLVHLMNSGIDNIISQWNMLKLHFASGSSSLSLSLGVVKCIWLHRVLLVPQLSYEASFGTQIKRLKGYLQHRLLNWCKIEGSEGWTTMKLCPRPCVVKVMCSSWSVHTASLAAEDTDPYSYDCRSSSVVICETVLITLIILSLFLEHGKGYWSKKV